MWKIPKIFWIKGISELELADKGISELELADNGISKLELADNGISELELADNPLFISFCLQYSWMGVVYIYIYPENNFYGCKEIGIGIKITDNCIKLGLRTFFGIIKTTFQPQNYSISSSFMRDWRKRTNIESLRQNLPNNESILVFQRHILSPLLLFCRGPTPSSLFKNQSIGSQILGPSVLTPTRRWLTQLSANRLFTSSVYWWV